LENPTRIKSNNEGRNGSIHAFISVMACFLVDHEKQKSRFPINEIKTCD